ncbi:malto-oligosyltrehalose synthase [Tropicimonas sp. IMCC34011]|uniref:malto-oligosyltrehalose synthase n=1 Tax=Tropicimonas sp. IMCC34011 TaxID=2248759 RepID=UPI000E22FFCC|nr:malto-oligosyltrehalose synthase [Tropicimonas sp. IMCC34011]
MRDLSATYRVQLREGVDFDRVRDLIPYFTDLGISDIYLSPIFAAGSGSTHGYDVIDPSQIEPDLGGREGFSRLAAAAKEAGLGVIIDIVPNHTAFSLENPWLRDVLRHGQDSRYAPHFDINWDYKLVLPFLPAPFEKMLREGQLSVDRREDGPVFCAGGLDVPMAPGTEPEGDDADALREAHGKQPWRLTHWEFERDGVTHRRFFQITGLVGMRVEDSQVFEDTHALVLDLVKAGEVTGLRIDHIDGLADPAAYLDRLRERIGPDVPVWVEKILVGEEPLPDWPIEGTTGYEAGRAIARVLTEAEGIAKLDEAWRDRSGREEEFGEVLDASKREVLTEELAAELRQLIDLARPAVFATGEAEPGDEALRQAIRELLVRFPRYRTYYAGNEGRDGDDEIMDAVAEASAAVIRSETIVRELARMIRAAATPAEERFRVRFQQVTGALLAKGQEDTAGFRFNRYLAANEVGAEPDEPEMSIEAFAGYMGGRMEAQPKGLTLTSSHDTKRSEDARMRLVAMSRDADAFISLFDASAFIPGHDEVDPNLRWYVVQAFLAIWEPHREDIPDRLVAHVEKAIREAKEITTWAFPDEEAEGKALGFTRTLAERWSGQVPPPAMRLMQSGERLSLAQVALKAAMPGIPDIYQGCEGASFALTDPDNRQPVDWGHMAALVDEEGFSASKARLTRVLLRLRRERPGLFAGGASDAVQTEAGLIVCREGEGARLSVEINLSGHPYDVGEETGGDLLYPTDERDREGSVTVRLTVD